MEKKQIPRFSTFLLRQPSARISLASKRIQGLPNTLTFKIDAAIYPSAEELEKLCNATGLDDVTMLKLLQEYRRDLLTFLNIDETRLQELQASLLKVKKHIENDAACGEIDVIDRQT